MKSKQFCSVCKDWLEMEVVPTGDGDDDDGVIWFRCPQCQGFLPKLSGGDLQPEADAAPEDAAGDGADAAAAAGTDDMPWDSPAEMMAARDTDADADAPAADTGDAPVSTDSDFPVPDLPVDDIAVAEVLGDDSAAVAATEEAGKAPDEPPADPIHEYAAMLAAADVSTSTPYRPWATYEVGQCLHHLAWDDCGIVVQKEELPGGRKVIKCYFEDAGVVRLIEQAPR